MKNFRLQFIIGIMMLMMVQNSFGFSISVKNQSGTSLAAGTTVQKGTLLVVEVASTVYNQASGSTLKFKYNWAGGSTSWADVSGKPANFYVPCDNNYTSVSFKASGFAAGCYGSANQNNCYAIETGEFYINLNGVTTTLPNVTVNSYRLPSDPIPCDGQVDGAWVSLPNSYDATKNLAWYVSPMGSGSTFLVKEINNVYYEDLQVTSANSDGPYFVKVKGCTGQTNTITIQHRRVSPTPTNLSANVSCMPRKLTIGNCSTASSVSYTFSASTGAPAFNPSVTTSGVPSSTYVYSIPTANPGSSYSFQAVLKRTGFCDSNPATITYTVPSICAARKSVVNADLANEDEVNAKIVSNENNQTIDITLPNGNLSNISIVNMQGQLVKSMEMTSASANISINDLKAGVYIVDVKQDGQSFTHKVQVVK